MSQEVWIVGAMRTPVGKFMGSLMPIPAQELGAIAIKSVLEKTGVQPEIVDETYLGNVIQAGLGQNSARQAALRAGIPQEKPASTINMVCGSGLKSVMLAAMSIQSGNADTVLAGGMENMSAAPYLLPRAREGYRMGDQVVQDAMIKDGLWCAFGDVHMGITAENVAEKYHVSRQEQDEFSLWSQEKTAKAQQSHRFADEIVPVPIPQRKGEPKLMEQDEFPRPSTTLEALSKLRPAFKKDGTVTAGNASGVNDGAAAILVMSREKAESLGLQPLARIVSYACVGLDPAYMGLGPIGASRKALQRAGMTVADLDLYEVNEAFASQSIQVAKELELEKSKLNVNGGAIAIGHPVGASGARIFVTLLYEMQKREARRGLATLCIGGGMGAAMIVER